MISESDVLIDESEEPGSSYLNLVVVKIRTALRDELEKNEWKIEIAANDQRIIVERLLGVHCESLLCASAEFAPSEIDRISYSDLINEDDPDFISKEDLFGALAVIEQSATPEPLDADHLADDQPEADNESGTRILPTKNLECEENLDNEEHPHSCRTCGKAFRRKRTLEAHIAKKHSNPGENRSLLCNACGVSFKSKKLLRQHVIKTHDSRTWPCKYCGKHFNSVKHARRHEQSVHLGKTKLSCPTCEKDFASKENLGRHMQTVHEGKKVLCEICGKGFTAVHSMKIHVELVHMQKRLPCTFCGKEVSEVHMQRHVKSVHQGIRYKCDMCSKSFDRPYRLKKHKQTSHQTQSLIIPDPLPEVPTVSWLNLPVADSLEIVGTEDLLKLSL